MVQSPESNVIYSEWQLPNFSSFLPNLLFAPAIWLVFAPFNEAIGSVLGIFLTFASVAIRIFVAKRIRVSDTTLSIGKADIPLEALGNCEVISADQQFFERGALLDARAFLALKSGLPGLVKIEVTDPKDPTPYILVATRNPGELANAVSKR